MRHFGTLALVDNKLQKRNNTPDLSLCLSVTTPNMELHEPKSRMAAVTEQRELQ
jgi:hypothetical protein